ALAEDERVAAIALYIEGLRDVPGFAAAAAQAQARNVPVVVLKAGRSELGAALALSHTSSLAGDDSLYQALFGRMGVLRVDTLPALVETAKLLAVAGPPRGDRLAIFTCSGGECLIAADRAAALGLTLPRFSNGQAAALRAQLPPFATVANPLDYNTSLWGDLGALTRCFTTALSGEVDAGLLVIHYRLDEAVGRGEYDASVDAMITASRAAGKPGMVVSTLPELLPAPVRERLIAAGLVPLQGLDEALTAFAGGARLRQRWSEVAAQPALVAGSPQAGGGARRVPTR